MWEDETLWRGVADEANQLEAIRAAHRTGRGEWYAVIEVAKASREYAYLWEHITAAHEKCSSLKTAVAAAHRLMAKKCDWLDADMEVSVNVRSALEWRPDDWEVAHRTQIKHATMGVALNFNGLSGGTENDE